MRLFYAFALAAAASGMALGQPANPTEATDVVLADFETDSYGTWLTAGTAFGSGPVRRALPGQGPAAGFVGTGFASSAHGGDASIGSLLSPPFVLEGTFLHFLIGGGHHPGLAGVNLLVGGAVLRTATASNSGHLRWHTWNVSDLAGQLAQIQVLDHATGEWGHVTVDHFYLSDQVPTVVDDREWAVVRALASVQNAAERAARDLSRPQYHFRPPAQWLGDPSGLVHDQGYYQVFYQHHPYGDQPGRTHWGHARSRDLLSWEHLPPALWPSQAMAEQHCQSGSLIRSAAGQLMIFYTSIGHAEPQCWIALPTDDELVRWAKFPGNPILSLRSPGGRFDNLRQPYLFAHGGRTYLVHPGASDPAQSALPVLSLHEADNPELTQWKHRGVLFRHPDPGAGRLNSASLVSLGGQFVLLTSSARGAEYFTGQFDATQGTFSATGAGRVDAGDAVAPQTLLDPQGRTLLWARLQGFEGGRGWNGCWTLPRVLSLEQSKLVQTVAPELERLRGTNISLVDLTLTSTNRVLEELSGTMLELAVRLRLGEARAAGLRLRCSSDGARAVTLQYDGATLDVAGARLPLPRPGPSSELRLRVFLDQSVLECYAEGGSLCVSRVLRAAPTDVGIELFATDGTATFTSLEAWPMQSIW